MEEEQLLALRRLLAIVDRYQLSELVVEEEGVTVTIHGAEARRAPEWDLGFSESMLPDLDADERPDAPEAETSLSGEAEEIETDALHPLLSPMTGLFYRAASPDSPAFVQEGDVVEKEQTVGLIEAMKVFSEIPADVTGVVVRIVVESGVLVSQGDTLMLLALEAPAV